MTIKDQIFEKIGGDQVHHLWQFLTKNWWEAEFNIYQGVWYFQAYNGYKWYVFNDPAMNSESEMMYDVCKAFNDQDASVYEILLRFLDQV